MADTFRRVEGSRREIHPGGEIVRLTEPYVAPRAVRIPAGTTYTIPEDGVYTVEGESTEATHISVPTPTTGQRDIILRNPTDTVCYVYPKNCTFEGQADRIQLVEAGILLRAEHLTNWIVFTLGAWNTSWEQTTIIIGNIPPPRHPGDILFSLDGQVWVPAHPLTSTRGGWLVNDEAYTVVDSP